MAATLEDGRLVVVTADQHTGYQVNDCVDDVVHRYLIDLEAPERPTADTVETLAMLMVGWPHTYSTVSG